MTCGVIRPVIRVLS